MDILHSEVVPVRPGTTPDYNQNNPMVRLLQLVESAQLAAGRESYPFDELQFLFPVRSMILYGPSAPDSDVLDPTRQDNKVDFQKQNVTSFDAADTQIIRGVAAAGGWSGPFIRLTYRGGPDSVLANKAGNLLGPTRSSYGPRSATPPSGPCSRCPTIPRSIATASKSGAGPVHWLTCGQRSMHADKPRLTAAS
jgi:hypothetical protein